VIGDALILLIMYSHASGQFLKVELIRDLHKYKLFLNLSMIPKSNLRNVSVIATAIGIASLFANVAPTASIFAQEAEKQQQSENEKKEITFSTVIVLLDDNGGVKDLKTLQQTINGTDDELKQEFDSVLKEYYPLVPKTNETTSIFVYANNTAKVFSTNSTNATQKIEKDEPMYYAWFNDMLKNDPVLTGKKLQPKEKKTQWFAVCRAKPAKCMTSHS
jgi:hypothetical protein